MTDDPDDHQTFTEAINRVATDTIVLIVVDSSKARKLLISQTHVPDYLLIDLSMDGLDIKDFLDAIRGNPLLTRIPILTYGSPSEYADIDDRMGLVFFAKDYEYSQLQAILSEFLSNRFS